MTLVEFFAVIIGEIDRCMRNRGWEPKFTEAKRSEQFITCLMRSRADFTSNAGPSSTFMMSHDTFSWNVRGLRTCYLFDPQFLAKLTEDLEVACDRC